MSWKRQVQLLDLEPDQRFEVRCRRCSQTGYMTPDMMGERQLYLDEAEARMSCAQGHCGGPVLVSMSTQGASASFSGGIS